ncbi:MAG: hypothetical protein H6744_04755 [Deltaproteobacteria bacterium]|nr:hypothetical protein [Deltaproteobacteria bacterium]MCB9785986.1 hypothetical protein [Deltaproteobacteria bacterium]
MRLSNQAAVVGVLAATFLFGACNDIPISGLEKSFSIHVRKTVGNGDAIPIDFLWVVDDSSSMCEEQVALTDNFQQFSKILAENFDIDPRVAVVTPDMHCTMQESLGKATKGQFSTQAATGFPPACQARQPVPCTTNEQCANLDCTLFGTCDAEGTWTCRKAQNASCVENPNGTLNSTCRRSCTTDDECQQLFDDPRYICQKLSGSPADWGCLLPPPTSNCPASVGPVLDLSTIDQFACLATVGVNQAQCFKYEQGMRGALTALDANGPNKANIACTKQQEKDGECKRFLRDEAYLVIIFVSDEDDCSADVELPEDKHDQCGLLDDQTSGGPLIPVNHFVNRFKSLKSDPGRVIVAAISGDALPGEPLEPKELLDEMGNPTGETYCSDLLDQVNAGTLTEVEASRECFLRSKDNPFVCFHTTTICTSSSGQADWGRRYQQLAERFGDNGVFENICSAAGLGPALERIAARIVQVVGELCLPKGVEDVETLVVQKTQINSAGQPIVDPVSGQPVLVTLQRVETFTPGAKNTYRLKEAGAQACQDGSGFIRPSIIFPDDDLPRAGEEIIISYKANPELKK